jgi:serine/threonine protein phosphatase PrpC
VKWEEASEEENSPKASTITARRSLLGLRKLSISPAGFAFTPDHVAAVPELDIGTCVLLEGGKDNSDQHSGSFLTSIETSMELEKLGMRFSGVYTGRGGALCAKYVYEHLQRCIVDALGHSPQGNDFEAVFAESFKNCDDGFNSKYYKDSSGTSALAVLIRHRTIHVAWVGDIRAVLKSGNEVRALTIDHHPSEPTEKKRILRNGGLIVGGQIMGILSTSRGFGDNDLKAHLSDGVLIAEPSVVSATIDDAVASTKLCFLVLASHSLFSVMTNDTCCKIVARALSRHDNNPNIAAKILAKTAERKSQQETAVTVIVWNDSILQQQQQQRSRSSSAASWRSLRSFSAFETIGEHDQ